MSRLSQEWIIGLGKRVTRRQQHFLFVLTRHHQENRETWWPSHEVLAAEWLCDCREIRRIVAELDQRGLGLFEFTPGVGRGNRGSYKFPFEQEKRGNPPSFVDAKEGRKEGRKEGQNDSLIRKDKRQDLKTHPLIPSRDREGTLNTRQVRELRKQMRALAEQYKTARPKIERKDPDPNCRTCSGAGATSKAGHDCICPCTFREVVTPIPSIEDQLLEACRVLLLPLEAARRSLLEAGVQIGEMRKEPQSVTA